MIKVYLSGPISSPIPDVDREELKSRFNSLQRWLKRNFGNWEVINPLQVMPDCNGGAWCNERGRNVNNEHSWECWLRYDLIEMLKCDAICLLPGWEDSRGAMVEADLARKLGLAPYYALLDDEKGWSIA